MSKKLEFEGLRIKIPYLRENYSSASSCSSSKFDKFELKSDYFGVWIV